MSKILKKRFPKSKFDIIKAQAKLASTTTDESHILKYSKCKHPVILNALLSNPNMGRELKMKLITVEYNFDVASNLSAFSKDEEFLTVLSFAPQSLIRHRVLYNCYTPLDAILRLAEYDSNVFVRLSAESVLERRMEGYSNV